MNVNAKIILCGEHAVVYNKPAIALPLKGLDIYCEISNSETNTIDCELYKGSLDDCPNDLMNIKEIYYHCLKKLNKINNKHHLKFISKIPIARGLGSSAASSASLIKAIYNFYDIKLETEELFNLCQIAESIAHYNPSGVDARVITTNKALYFSKTLGFKSFDFNLKAGILIIDSGIIGKTKEAVLKLKKLKDANPLKVNKILDQIEMISTKCYKLLKNSDLKAIGHLMNKNHSLLSELDLSNETLDNICKIANDNGAYGAKLTGGGLGGCVIVLCELADLTNLKSLFEKLNYSCYEVRYD